MAENLRGRISERLHSEWETFESERLKNAAVLALHGLAKHQLGHQFLDIARGSERFESSRLHVHAAGLDFESPVIVGPGWDEDGRAVDGLYLLGFAGTEVGTVTLWEQFGKPQPRMWYKDGRGLNCMGFNSPGSMAVAHNLARQERNAVVGINIGKNKDTPNQLVANELAVSAAILGPYADYFVLNFQSPNTKGLRESMFLLLEDSYVAVDETLRGMGLDIPIFIKTSVDMTKEELDKTIRIVFELGAAGIVDSNTTDDPALKAKYGWAGMEGGLSGDIPEFRDRRLENTKYIGRHFQKTGKVLIVSGGISNSATAIESSLYGGHLFEVVTGMRQNKAKTPSNINRGILHFMDNNGFKNYEDMVGAAL